MAQTPRPGRRRRAWLLGDDAPPLVRAAGHERARRRPRISERWPAWTAPTSTEAAVVLKGGLAAALAWWLATVVTEIPDPLLGSLAALITVRVSVRASVREAVQRSAAVVLGVILATALGDALGLTALSVGLLTTASLGAAQLVLRLPRAAATQVPVSVLVVVAADAGIDRDLGWARVVATLLGGAVGVAVSLALPASRVADARQTVGRLGAASADALDTMGTGLARAWTSTEAAAWRRSARVVRERLVGEAREAVGSGRAEAQWNVRDRRHSVELGRYDRALPRLERTAIGVSVIARGLDDHVHLAGGEHGPMREMAALLAALGELVRVATRDVLDAPGASGEEALALAELRRRRGPCARSASLRVPVEGTGGGGELTALGWMNYTAILVQVDRIVDDLRATAPA